MYPFERLRLWCGCREFAEREDISTIYLCVAHGRLGRDGAASLANARAAIDIFGIQHVVEVVPYADTVRLPGRLTPGDA